MFYSLVELYTMFQTKATTLKLRHILFWITPRLCAVPCVPLTTHWVKSILLLPTSSSVPLDSQSSLVKFMSVTFIIVSVNKFQHRLCNHLPARSLFSSLHGWYGINQLLKLQHFWCHIRDYCISSKRDLFVISFICICNWRSMLVIRNMFCKFQTVCLYLKILFYWYAVFVFGMQSFLQLGGTKIATGQIVIYLNGPQSSHAESGGGVNWMTFRGLEYSLKIYIE